ncbi:HTH-type transcriptional regulator TreR [Oceanobacillus oncorhynchi subsp. incaldanensis]|uniref:Trehalose operon repressor n=1 Tax=Oceanobacillus oncorhynchi TaxID=545501 RepID=A0A0A1MSF5_9BACI|nr:trehalose operon repressor [Oceanobacillus oncorhynchi]UUI40484.1 trehalose operon repressor [Oceanobacillus oncorhynchi]GIO18582.1 HTH-type transcriptional regulator TreR [Oceanobacillus oncorhynchi subsp. incaldanensis]CEI81906.1 Trehalose operon transcriptional repressor [Oceanobacillus oncorhynchi]
MRNKYVLIYQEMVQKIEKETFKANEFLPSENELAEQYQTSRETIRKALNLLAQNGYIQKIRGKGSTVIERNKFDFPVSGLVSFKELADKMGEKPITAVHQCAKVSANDFIQKQLKLKDNQEVWEIIRTRSFSEQRIILDKDYLITKTVPYISKDIAETSIYNYLENELGLIISFAKKEIIVEEPTAEDRELLDLEGFHNIVVIKNYVYLDDATLFQYTESRHRPDKFRFVDFARREH